MFRRRSRFTSLLLLGLLAGACDSTRTVAPRVSAPPASSATGAVKRFEFAFNHRDVAAIAGLLADDMRFVTAAADSAGSIASESWAWERLLAALHSLLLGDPGGPPPAVRVNLAFDHDLVEFPDTRPGRAPDVHRTVRTPVSVRVERDDGAIYEATGYLVFFVTRGDSALIPADQRVRGATATASRWWIDRIEDETLPSGGLRTMPASPMWFGRILSLYDAWVGPGLHSPSASRRRRS